MIRSLRMLLWLRWRLAWHQWRREPLILQIVGAVAAGAGALLLVIGSLTGFLAGSILAPGMPPGAHRLIGHVLTAAALYVEILDLSVALQRGELPEIRKLLILPVSPGELFVVHMLGFPLWHTRVGLWATSMAFLTGPALKDGPRWLWLMPAVTALLAGMGVSRYCAHALSVARVRNPEGRRLLGSGFVLLLVVLISLAACLVQPMPPAQRTPGPNRVLQADPAQDARQQAVLQITVWERILQPLETWVPPSGSAARSGSSRKVGSRPSSLSPRPSLHGPGWAGGSLAGSPGKGAAPRRGGAAVSGPGWNGVKQPGARLVQSSVGNCPGCCPAQLQWHLPRFMPRGASRRFSYHSPLPW